MKEVDIDDVQIFTCETIITECCKSRILPFKKITAITINGKKLSDKDVSILESVYHISLETVYDEPFEKLDKYNAKTEADDEYI